MRALVFILFLSGAAWANAPAPWAVCYGKKAGDSCSSIYYPFGRCLVDDAGCQGKGSCLTCRSKGGCDIGDETPATAAAVIGAVALLLFRRRRTV